MQKHKQGSNVTDTVACEKLSTELRNQATEIAHTTNKAQVKTTCSNETRLTEPKPRKHNEGLWWPTKGHLTLEFIN